MKMNGFITLIKPPSNNSDRHDNKFRVKDIPEFAISYVFDFPF